MTGKTTNKFPTPVCNIFRPAVLEGQLCYRADLNILRGEVDKKDVATEGFVFLLDYNFDRMVEIEGVEDAVAEEMRLLKKENRKRDQAMTYIETLGKNDFLLVMIFEFYET